MGVEATTVRHTLMVDASCDYEQGRILRLASQFDVVKFAYQPRRKNHNAHRLARKGARETSPTTRSDLFAP